MAWPGHKMEKGPLMARFKPGDHVTLRKDVWDHAIAVGAVPWGRPEIQPQYGVVYTVRTCDRQGVRFVEIVNELRFYFDLGKAELSYNDEEYELVVERKTDISVFERILVDATKRKVLE